MATQRKHKAKQNPYVSLNALKEAAADYKWSGKWLVKYRAWWKDYGEVYKAPYPPPYQDTLQGYGKWFKHYGAWRSTDPRGDYAHPPPAHELRITKQ